MKHDFSKFSDNTMLAEFVMDIYANHDTGEITILYDMEFDKKLLHLEYFPDKRILDFVFEDLGAVTFGVELQTALCPYFEKASEATLLHMDMETNKAVSGMVAPLKVKQNSSLKSS